MNNAGSVKAHGVKGKRPKQIVAALPPMTEHGRDNMPCQSTVKIRTPAPVLGRFPVSQGLEPHAHGHALALGCLPVALPLPRRHPEPHNGSGWVFYGGSPTAALGLFHACIMWLQIIIDKGAAWVFNVATLNKEAQMIKVYEYRTGRLLAEVKSEARMDRWCWVRGYLPHHKVAGGWVVIK